jgi:hypothetical protein
MPLARSFAFLSLLAGFSACTGVDLHVTETRVRTGFGEELNADRGWAVTGDFAAVQADRPFRLRFEVEASEPVGGLGLEARRAGGPWVRLLARDFPYPDEISTPLVSIVDPGSWAAGAPTTDLLDTSAEPFSGGAGLGLDSLSGPVPTGQSEWEWGVVIRRWGDGAEMIETGESVEFRMVDESRAPVPGSSLTVQVEVPWGHLGGTYAETPGRLGPWQSEDGRLWFPMEPAETFNVLMMLGSADGGAIWTEYDGANRPVTDDLEGFATAFRQGTIHILHQISEKVVYHAFSTEGAGAWTVRDELVAEHPEPPVQAVSLEVLEDGTLVAVFASGTLLEVRIRSMDGGWVATDTLTGRSGEGWILSGPATVVTSAGQVHLAWTETNGSAGVLYHGVLSPEGRVGSQAVLATGLDGTEADVASVAPLAHLPKSQEVAVVWRKADGRLAERRVRSDGTMTGEAVISQRMVTQNAVDSDQVGADLVAIGGRLHILFLDEETGAIYHTEAAETGQWSPAEPVVDGIRGQWVRGQPVRTPDGRIVYGFVYDAGSDGGSGMNRYGEVEIGG